MSLTHSTVAMMLPVSDVDRARTFYTESLGLDYTGTDDEVMLGHLAREILIRRGWLSGALT